MQVIGYDAKGIARVYGNHDNRDIAETMAKDAALAYIHDRPDTGPYTSWKFLTFASNAERRRYENRGK